MNEFGFSVKKLVQDPEDSDYWIDETDPDFVDNEGPFRWRVELPHQCGPWRIAEREPLGNAIQNLQRFIAEANRALTDLYREDARNG